MSNKVRSLLPVIGILLFAALLRFSSLFYPYGHPDEVITTAHHSADHADTVLRGWETGGEIADQGRTILVSGPSEHRLLP